MNFSSVVSNIGAGFKLAGAYVTRPRKTWADGTAISLLNKACQQQDPTLFVEALKGIQQRLDLNNNDERMVEALRHALLEAYDANISKNPWLANLEAAGQVKVFDDILATVSKAAYPSTYYGYRMIDMLLGWGAVTMKDTLKIVGQPAHLSPEQRLAALEAAGSYFEPGQAYHGHKASDADWERFCRGIAADAGTLLGVLEDHDLRTKARTLIRSHQPRARIFTIVLTEFRPH